MSTRSFLIRSGADLGRVVRDARELQQLTQAQAVESLGLGYDRTRLARIENGEATTAIDRLLLTLRRLGVDVVAHLELPEQPNSNHDD